MMAAVSRRRGYASSGKGIHGIENAFGGGISSTHRFVFGEARSP